MKRLYIFLFLTVATLSLQATVKPRYQGWQSHYTEEQVEQPNTNVYLQGPRRVGKHSTAPLTSLGSPRVPVILVQFQDLKFISGLPEGTTCETQEDIELVNAYYDLFCNGLRDETSHWTSGGSAGAIREYFRDQSDGIFKPDFYIIGPVTLDNGYAYYGENGSSKDKNINLFFSESVRKAQEIYSNWSMFDNDGNGSVDMAFFVFAGEGENAYDTSKVPEAKNYIWPKEQATGGTINSVSYGCYACCNETYKGVSDGIGVFVHELSHALGLPDMYDYNYKAYGLDYWDIMDSGCYCQSGYVPCGYSAYEKDFMGWTSLITLDPSEPQHLVLEPQQKGGKTYKILHPSNNNEYYILENRQNKGWDTFIGRGNKDNKSHGMLITHIDYEESLWTSNRLNTNPLSHQRCTIIAADGIIHSYMNVYDVDTYNEFLASVKGDPFPGSGNVTSWEGTEDIVMPYIESMKTVSLPVSYTGNSLDQPLLNIVELADGTIELDYCPGGKVPTAVQYTLANTETEAAVYSITGQKLGMVRMQGKHPQIDNLPAGIYLVQGRKYIVK